MEHKHPAPARPDIVADPVSAPPVGPLIPSTTADHDADEHAVALPEPELYDPDASKDSGVVQVRFETSLPV